MEGADISPVLSNYRKTRILTDLNLVLDSGAIIPVHRIILVSASEYFSKLLLPSGFKEVESNIPIGGISQEVMELYLDYVYGNPIKVNNLEQARSLFGFINFTGTLWKNKDLDVTNLNIPSEKYREYIDMLDEIYGGHIPLEVIANSAKYIVNYVDLNGLSPEFIQTVIDSRFFLPLRNDSSSLIRRQIYQNLIDNGYNLVWSMGNLPNTTSELKKIARNLGLDQTGSKFVLADRIRAHIA